MDYQGFKVIEPVSFFRGVAREALKGRWGLAWGAGFLYMILMQLPITIFDSLFGTKMDTAALAGMIGAGADAAYLEEIYGDSLSVAATSPISGIYSFLTAGAFSLGIAIFVIHILRRAEAGPSMIFSGFSNYLKSLGVMVLIGLISMAVVLVFMIPVAFMLLSGSLSVMGLSMLLMLVMFAALIVVYLIYALVYFILADNPGMGVVSCLRMSRHMMKGNKGKLFLLYLSFIGWALLYFLYVMIIGGVLIMVPSNLLTDIVSALLVALGAGVLTVYVLTAEAAFYEKVSGISSGMFNLSENIPTEIPEK